MTNTRLSQFTMTMNYLEIDYGDQSGGIELGNILKKESNYLKDFSFLREVKLLTSF